jgi:isoleucyl-tRNA synthetase
MFQPLPSVPDHPGLEREVLDWWEEKQVFDRLRELNREGPTWSFVDGPITANNPMGVHHCWGRTLKDAFQRYKALQGFDQRYQNGFDCQGLWVEVNVERMLGLNSKPEIEEYGLAAFAEKCKESVAEYSEVITDQSKRLGMWMDWDNDYYTFSDTNIEYIWRFLKTVHERGWLYTGHRSNVWCPRCGTSISQHELIGSYEDRSDPSLYVRLPLLDEDGDALVVWTTTPWTLPANVAAAVDPGVPYVKLSTADGLLWVAEARLSDLPFEGEVVAKAKGAELVGKRYEGPYDHLAAAEEVEHRVIPWDDVTMEEGTGIVHIAPGCGAEDFELSRVHDLSVLTPVDEAGRFYDSYGWLHGTSTAEAKDQIIGDLGERGRLLEAGEIVHRYPVCWRCHTPLIFRIVDEWFIACDEIRQPMLEANATVKWTPDFYSKRMDDWLRNMGDWNISRKRYFGLPLPLYPCECGHLNVIGSRAELEERATGGLDQLQELHRPWIDDVPIRCDECGGEVRRIPEVGDAWLDAGIVPFSTLGWENPEWKEHGYATGSSQSLSGADLPDHAYWETWFPADWVSEMREQIRLWFYSQLFMSVALVGKAPYKEILAYEKLRDETGKEMHKSWGNAIEANEAMDKMGADVMRFMYCDHVPQQNLNFGYGPANEIKRRLLTFWNSASFFVLYANIEGFKPTYRDLSGGPQLDELRPLDRWLLARTQQLLHEATDAYERFWTPDVTDAWERFTDDLSNWYIRRSRKRFYTLDESAFRTLWYALVQAVRVIAPVMPFLAEHMWRNLAAPVRQAPQSAFLAGWPRPASRYEDPELLAEVADARLVAELARAARDSAGIKLRQPLRRLVVASSDPGRRMLISRQVEELAAELRVKEVAILESPGEVAEMRAKPRLDLVGPRYGPNLPELRRLLEEGSFEVTNGTLRAGGYILSKGEFMLEYVPREGWEVKHEDEYLVGVDTRLDDELVTEGRVYDLIHSVQRLRRDAGLEVTDRIVLTIPQGDGALLSHRDWIAGETLAEEVQIGDELAVRKAG